MYKGIYRIADTVLEIDSLYPRVQEMCLDYRAEGEPEVRIVTGQAEVDRERELGEKNPEEGAGHFPDDYLETLAVYRKIAEWMLHHDTLLFHGSVVAVDGSAYLFTAASGTGKSTHTRLWRQLLGDRAVMVNDDKPLLKVREDGVWACGTPWNGKHHLSTNISVPLRAICILERGAENEIHEISAKEMLPMLMQQSYRPASPRDYPVYLTLLDKLAGQMKFCRLHCNMEPEAARISYNFLSRG